MYTQPTTTIYRWFLIILLWLTGQRDIFKFGGDFAPILSLFYGILLVWLLAYQPRFWDKLRLYRWPIPLAFICITAIAVIFVYPYADGLKANLGGSDQDDAVMLCGQSLLRGDFPYAQRTYLNNPASPAPGMLLMFLPSILTGWYPLTTVLALIVGAMMMHRKAGRLRLNRFIAALSLSLLFWDHLAVGSDLIVIGILVLICTTLSSTTRDSTGVVSLIIISGVLGATRTVFAFLPLMYGFIVWQQNKKEGLIVGAAGTLITCFLHGIFLFWDAPNYSPLHLVGKGGVLLAGWWKPLTLALTALTGTWLLYTRSAKPTFAYTTTLLTLSSSLGMIALASLFTFHAGSFTFWEGANYFMPLLPTFLWVATYPEDNTEVL